MREPYGTHFYLVQPRKVVPVLNDAYAIQHTVSYDSHIVGGWARI